MNSMNVNDERFFDLAMKVIAGQASDAERAELDALLAMLESGGTRGSTTDEITLLKQTWQTTVVHSFSDAEALRAWETSPTDERKQPTVKIIYDATAGEVRVLGRWKEKPLDKTFLVEGDLATTLKLVKDYVTEQTKR